MFSLLIAEITAMEARLRQAQLHSDVDELQLLIADELLFVTPNGQIATKSMDLHAHGEGLVRFSRVDLVDLDILPVSEDMAMTFSHISLVLSLEGTAVEGDFRYLRTWRKYEEHWHIVGGGCWKIEG